MKVLLDVDYNPSDRVDIGSKITSRYLLFVVKAQTDTIDAMTFIGGCLETFPLEDMTQMASTVGAGNFSALHAKTVVFVPTHSTCLLMVSKENTEKDF